MRLTTPLYGVSPMAPDKLSAGFQEISVDALHERLQSSSEAASTAVVDVRTAWEFSKGHIAGALHIPLDTLSDTVRSAPHYPAVRPAPCQPLVRERHTQLSQRHAANHDGYDEHACSHQALLLVGLLGMQAAHLAAPQCALLSMPAGNCLPSQRLDLHVVSVW